MEILKATSLSKIYQMKKGISHKALDEFNLTVEEGEFVGIMGPSGSGKTTLLNILATIDTATSGELKIKDFKPSTLSSKKLALFRRKELGFVFQDYNLLDTLTIEENILLPLTLDKTNVSEMKQRVNKVAGNFGITSILQKRTYEVSGGQQQRAAIARAIIQNPLLVLADEPTGNLDSKASKDVMQAMATLNEQRKTSIVLVTHDPFAASYCKRIVFIKDGKCFTEIHQGSNRQAFFQEILDVLSLLGGDVNEFQTIRP